MPRDEKEVILQKLKYQITQSVKMFFSSILWPHLRKLLLAQHVKLGTEIPTQYAGNIFKRTIKIMAKT